MWVIYLLEGLATGPTSPHLWISLRCKNIYYGEGHIAAITPGFIYKFKLFVLMLLYLGDTIVEPYCVTGTGPVTSLPVVTLITGRFLLINSSYVIVPRRY